MLYYNKDTLRSGKMNQAMKQAIMKAFPGRDTSKVEINVLRLANISDEEMLRLDQGELGD